MGGNKQRDSNDKAAVPRTVSRVLVLSLPAECMPQVVLFVVGTHKSLLHPLFLLHMQLEMPPTGCLLRFSLYVLYVY